MKPEMVVRQKMDAFIMGLSYDFILGRMKEIIVHISCSLVFFQFWKLCRLLFESRAVAARGDYAERVGYVHIPAPQPNHRVRLYESFVWLAS
jgi:hypothetical protein